MRRVAFVAAALMLSRGAIAADQYLIEFSAKGAPTADCRFVSWQDEVVFHNSNASPVEIRVLDISNGGVRPGVPTSFVLQPAETSSLLAKVGANWTPNESNPASLWITHLDVPPGVAIASHGDIGSAGSCCSCANPGSFEATAFGSFALPVFHALVPPNVAHTHLGVGLGQLGSHLNVGIFNGGTTPATAVITIVSNCGGTVVDRRESVIPAQTAMQLSGFKTTTCLDNAVTLTTTYNVTVTVDQPSLSFVSSVADLQPPIAGSSFSAPN